MMLSKEENEILENLQRQRVPMTQDELCKNMNSAQFEKAIKELKENRVISSRLGKRGNIYYFEAGGFTAGEFDKLKEIIGEYLVEIRDFVEEVREHSEKTTLQVQETTGIVKNIYANVITLMGIFVAIFSLIMINASMIPAVIGKDAGEIAEICIAVNGSMLFVLAVLMALIRFFIIKSLKS